LLNEFQYILHPVTCSTSGADSAHLDELGRHQPEASLLEALHDVPAEASLDAIGLHGDEGTLHDEEGAAAPTKKRHGGNQRRRNTGEGINEEETFLHDMSFRRRFYPKRLTISESTKRTN